MSRLILEKIDESRILIALTREDMDILDLTFKQLNRKNEYSKKILRQILLKPELELDFYINDKQISIETIPQKNGCFLLITLTTKKSLGRKIYKIKEKEKTYLFEFKSSEMLLDSIELLYNKRICDLKNTVISCQNKYYIIIYAKGTLPFDLHAILTEFSNFLGDNFILSSRVIELGKILAKDNAIKTIGTRLKNK